MNERFLRACRRERVDTTPVWIMRQAGRYLPAYREVRKGADFLTMIRTPELAAEVTIQPVDLIGVDAAIIFSDILVIPEAMGLRLQVDEPGGPSFPAPVRSRDEVHQLSVADPERTLRYVLQAIELTKRTLGGRVPLIGFAGSPWTLVSYMIEGRGSREQKHVKSMMLDDPDLLLTLLGKTAHSVRLFLEAQLAAGADAVQLFDTLGGTLQPDHYRRFSLDLLHDIVSRIHRGGAPVIVFSKGAHHALRELSEIGADVVGLDWTIDMAEARRITADRVALQGNLDPSVLYASPDSIRREVSAILRKYGSGPGHVFNLGHGILPDVPPEHAAAMVQAVHELSPVLHG
jgi:uroporphyrinogen decarboxylase